MKKNRLFILIILIIFCLSCKKVPFYATEGAVIIISSSRTYLKTGGDNAFITVIGFNAGGEAIHDHTIVVFNATLGELLPLEVELIDGKAVVEFKSGPRSGVADITARSGNIEATPNPLQITIGSAALESLAISANPSNFTAGGGKSRIRIYAFDASGNLLSDIPIILSTTAGYFEEGKGVYVTDNDGMVEDFLRTSRSATVRAESGDKKAEMEIVVEEEEENQQPSADFTYSPSTPQKGEKVYFNGSLSSDSDGYIRSYIWDFGDGSTGYGEKISHEFTWLTTGNKTFTVVLKVTDNRGGVGVSSKTVTVIE